MRLPIAPPSLAVCSCAGSEKTLQESSSRRAMRSTSAPSPSAPNGTLFASGSNDTHGQDLGCGVAPRAAHAHRTCRSRPGHPLHQRRQLLASLGYDKSVRVWDVQSGRSLLTIDAENGTFRAICFTPDGKSLLTANGTDSGGGGDHLIRVWDLSSGKAGATFDPGEVMTALALSRDGKTLAMGSTGGAVKLLGHERRQGAGDAHRTHGRSCWRST